jgi:hypothetical protein
MVDKSQTTEIQRWTDSVDAEVYEELLNRYERILVFAGQLQEKLNQQKLLAAKNENLDRENQRLKRLVAVEESYVRLLENALEAVGVMKPEHSDGAESNFK